MSHPLQQTCIIHGDRHLVVFVGERHFAEVWRCACGEERWNASDRDGEVDFVCVEPDEEPAALAKLEITDPQEAKLRAQLEASLVALAADDADDDHHIASADQMRAALDRDPPHSVCDGYDDPTEGLTDAH